MNSNYRWCDISLFLVLRSWERNLNYFPSSRHTPPPLSPQRQSAILPRSPPPTLVIGGRRGPSAPRVNYNYCNWSIKTITSIVSSCGPGSSVPAVSSWVRNGWYSFRGEARQVPPVLADNNLHLHDDNLHQNMDRRKRFLHSAWRYTLLK